MTKFIFSLAIISLVFQCNIISAVFGYINKNLKDPIAKHPIPMAVVEKPIDDKIKLLVTPEYLEYDPAKGTNCWVDINLAAPVYEEDDNVRAPVDIVAVIDRSGSMGGGKLELVKKTLHFVVTQLTPKDRLCLIVYDDTVDLVFDLTSLTPENKIDIEAKIDAVQTRGSTNLCGGLLKGMQVIMSRTGVKADVASVLLLTDGLANVGISNTEGIIQAMKDPFAHDIAGSAKREAKKPQSRARSLISSLKGEPKEGATGGMEPADLKAANEFTGTVYTFGYGSDHNATMLKDISQAANGVYFFIDTNEKIPESFADCLGGLLSTVGQNISLKVELSNGATITEFIAKKTPTFNANKTSAEVALGDLQSEEQRDVLMELQLPVCSDLGADGGILNYASITLSYFNVMSSVMETVKSDLPVPRTNTGKPKTSNPLIDKQKNRILTMKALEDAKKKADEGKYEEGRELLMATKQQVAISATSDEIMVQGMMDDMDDMWDGMVDSAKYNSYGKSRAVNAVQAHCEQRSNFQAAPGKIMSYETKSKVAMKKKK
ncbi:hypothetical protein LOD99_11700 [Oopsacas minuta]|uniref:VWFA domain-containing protein n=1 Tax=Oopsacas minuta TaxID=111878 RepID=A0AAV7JKD7_9METZ|nr:hypothetical protein LOD99_11700 [Oopsacas minuta]